MTRVLLLHGLGCDHRIWDRLRPLLATDLEVLAPDLPGHGERPLPLGLPPSPAGLAAWVAQQDLDAAGLDRVHVVGSSLGGWVALELARAGRALSVTALAPAGLWGPGRSPRGTRPLLLASRALARVALPVAPLVARSALARRATLWHGIARPGDLTPAEAVALAEGMARASGFREVLEATRGVHLDATDLPASVPVTVVFGDRDRMLPARSAQVRDGLPAHTRWVVLPRCGHAPMIDAPARVAEIVRETVAAGSAPRPAPNTPGPARSGARPADLAAYGFEDLPGQTRDESGGWSSNDNRLREERPPHWE